MNLFFTALLLTVMSNCFADECKQGCVDAAKECKREAISFAKDDDLMREVLSESLKDCRGEKKDCIEICQEYGVLRVPLSQKH